MTTPDELRVVLVPTTRRDAEYSRRLLAAAGMSCSICADLEQAAALIDSGAGALLLSEEFLAQGGHAPLVEALRRQPPWADLPVVVLVRGGADSPLARLALDTLGNVTLLERPVRVATLVSMLKSSLRARARQYELRALVAQLATANENLEVQVQERTQELQASNAELEAFAYSVSHDLRAPLRGIDGFSLVLLEDYAASLDDQGRGYLQRIRSGAARMGELIDALLDLSRVAREPLRQHRVDLTEIARSVVRVLQRQVPDREITFDIQPRVRGVGDPRLLRGALENLLGNAVKFTRDAEVARVAFGVVRRQGERVYYVRDNGAGFDMAYASKLFVPFQRLHKQEEFVGTGVGLATVQRIVRRHGGRIWAEATPGEGAAFFFTLGEERTGERPSPTPSGASA